MHFITVIHLEIVANMWNGYTVRVKYKDSKRPKKLITHWYTTADFNKACDKFKEWTKI